MCPFDSAVAMAVQIDGFSATMSTEMVILQQLLLVFVALWLCAVTRPDTTDFPFLPFKCDAGAFVVREDRNEPTPPLLSCLLHFSPRNTCCLSSRLWE
jgi:hypothetical protein